MTIRKLLLATALATPAVLAFAAPAQAQVAGIATVDPTLAIGRSKALAAANQSIRTTFKDNLDKITAKEADLQKVLAQLDKNGDKQVSDDELEAAKNAKNPAYTQYAQMQQELNQLSTPEVRAQAFAIEMILQRYEEAQKSVVAAKKISVILTPESFVYAPEGVDVTAAVTASLDALVPTVPITAPADWRPQRQTLQVQQQLQQISQYAQAAAAAQGPGAAAPRPAGQPALPAGQPTTPQQTR